MTTYTWLPLTTALQNIQDRLNAGAWASQAELEVYLVEGLRLFNALTETWKDDCAFNVAGSQWTNLGTLAGSPRLRTVTDAQLCTQMEYMLLEPPVGIGTWTGTPQFTVEKLQSALSLRCNEVIQAAGCNTANLAGINVIPYTVRTVLPDVNLEIRRIRFLLLVANATGTAVSGAQTITVSSTASLATPLIVQGAGIQPGTIITSIGSGSIGISLPTTGVLSTTPLVFLQPVYMKRSDTQAFHYFNSDYPQESGTPWQWSVASEPPLSFDVEIAPDMEGFYDVLALQAGPTFGASPSLLGIPDDWSMIPMYGALADLLSEEPESTDRVRAEYCAKRYQDGLQMMRRSNWFVQGFINGVVADTPSLETKDRWQIGWQEDTGQIPSIVTDGIDQFNVTPCAAVSVAMTVIQNAPFLDSTDTFVQIARDDWDAVLDYVQHIGAFKQGGSDFTDTLPLFDEFLQYCQRKNRRQITYGPYADVLNSAGQKQDIESPRMDDLEQRMEEFRKSVVDSIGGAR
jgi:hypothetical protein